MLSKKFYGAKKRLSHTEESQGKRFFSWIVCAAKGSMAGSLNKKWFPKEGQNTLSDRVQRYEYNE